MILLIIILLICLFILTAQLQKYKYTGGRENIDKLDNSDTTNFINMNKKLIAEILENVKTIVNVTGIPENLKYSRSGTLLKHSIHIGQLKLFLSEIQCLTDSLDSCTDSAVVIYAGSAPSNKIPYIQKLFPNVKFVLIDPNEHFFMESATSNQYDQKNVEKYMYYSVSNKTNCPGYTTRIAANVNPYINTYITGIVLRSEADIDVPSDLSERISKSKIMCHVIEQYMTNDIAEKLVPLCKQNKTIFMSDIRGQLNSSGYPTDYDIIWNSAMMYNWISIMKPTRYMVKFRCPYEFGAKGVESYMREYNKHKNTHNDIKQCGINFLDNIKSGKFVYLKPECIWLQSFAPISSTEVRLVGNTTKTSEMSISDYENKIFYFNNIYRQYGYHTDHEDMLDYFRGIDRCGDCGLMCHIVKNYCSKPNAIITDPKQLIIDVLESIDRSLVSKGAHGLYFNKYLSSDSIVKLFEVRAASSVYRSTDCLITVPPDHNQLYSILKFRDSMIKKYTKISEYQLSTIILERILLNINKCGEVYDKIYEKFTDPMYSDIFKYWQKSIEPVKFSINQNEVRYGDLIFDIVNPSPNNLNHYLLKYMFSDFPKNIWHNTPNTILQSARVKHNIGNICELCLCESMRLYTDDIDPIYIIDGNTKKANTYTLVLFNNYGLYEPISHYICQSLQSKYIVLFNYSIPIDDPNHIVASDIELTNGIKPTILSNL